jgi:nicotinate-nucleotide adenylyltransferase
MTMKRVGIFSGTFDPIHNGHIRFALDALDQAGLDKVFFLVEPRPRRKQGVKAFEHRQAMVQLAIRDESRLGSIVLEQARFTPHETLLLLAARFKGATLCMLMGDDMLGHLNDWPQVEELVRTCTFVIGKRRNNQTNLIQERVQALEQTRGLSFAYQVFDSPLSGVSSSKVKAELRRTGKSADLPLAVQEYITQQGLYASSGVS